MKTKQIAVSTLSTLLLSGVSFSSFAQSAIEPLPPLTNAKGDIIEQIETVKKPNRFKRSIRLENTTEIKDWFNKSPSLDGIEGSGVDRVYKELAPHSNYKPVVVAVIDSGVDVLHEDLQGKIWHNPGEIADNGIDDDNNGYVDDIYGWNFIGGRDGSHVNFDTLEVTREYKKYLDLKASGTELTEEQKKYFEKVSKDYHDEYEGAKKSLEKSNEYKVKTSQFKQLLTEALGIEDFSKASLENITSTDESIIEAKTYLLSVLDRFGNYEKINEYVEYYSNKVNYYFNTDFDPRSDIVKDDPNNLWESNYGNNDVIGPDSDHGTHVAGIIAADRNNNLGIKGVASNVKIMALRVVPNGDERDKDVANAVRYAVDNGADIINMSFGKSYSPHKEVVDSAFLYAASKGVLLVHAAGNDSQNNDEGDNFPNRFMKFYSGYRNPNWLDVGASSYKKGENMVASFSNFGKRTVDLFAPGHKILSTTPNNQYAAFSGTSMAAPVVSGVAALGLSQYPWMNGYYLKQLLMYTTRDYPGLDVKSPEDSELVKFSSLSKSGGIVDAYTLLNVLK
ncbi:S8 family serine peptidase [Endozoicomonas sp. SM1973]|uniref:S8 family serine peptidase n=1 Tax=Spartinivicinus marinus TaxID=2994442 RepID=A0A853I9R9_9GAMM|nr:S8 family peptidase [Spartinivicinus marinus]MCX4027718.1 S8 family peptidase [Spartinivicinus marinus]NYZ68522.1 S8 family serine peptidase [Spartinivicinus marinus]